ncbi:MAG TPA: alpha-amylase family glycosyl hydrolase [Candidatus Binatia bacterium]|nr:alpha-amylase family glycosyl hydrolase [Candidatus Binatia bacterium]
MREVDDLPSEAKGASAAKREQPWWQRAVFYEITVSSFQDSDGDGKGDLPGLIQRLDYLEWLGVDALWLTPIYPSQMLDLGYDIDDYCAVHPMFGTLADFDRLLELLHARGMRLILDFVPNHTSDQHAWFRESRSSRSNPKRDWYVWADPAPNGGPPNNWLSRFGGSAWEWDDFTRQYYYHAFLREQPDLNWRNPDARAAIADALRFWLRRGVDGFRLDACAVLVEDEFLRDDPPDLEADEKTPPPQRLKRTFTDDTPETMSQLEELRRVVDEFADRVIAGEVQGDTDRIGHFYGNSSPRLHLPLNDALIDTPWDALSLQAAVYAYLKAVPEQGWPDWLIGGHDKLRMASKTGQAQARVLAMFLFTIKGTPFFYMGDELGMERVEIASNQVQDIFEKRVGGYGLNRDPERTPMRWDASEKAGFTTGEPWLPLGEGVAERNVATLRQDERSILWLYRTLIRLRRLEPALVAGDYTPLRSRDDVFAFLRSAEDATLLIALNLAPEARKYEGGWDGRLLVSTYLDRSGIALSGALALRPNEGVVVKLNR